MRFWSISWEPYVPLLSLASAFLCNHTVKGRAIDYTDERREPRHLLLDVVYLQQPV